MEDGENAKAMRREAGVSGVRVEGDRSEEVER